MMSKDYSFARDLVGEKTLEAMARKARDQYAWLVGDYGFLVPWEKSESRFYWLEICAAMVKEAHRRGVIKNED